MTGKEKELPCSAPGCPLFGDCIVDYEKTVKKPQTNADRIRAMSDEELAAVIMCPRETGAQIGSCVGKTCVECSLLWLKQPAEGG